MNIRALDLPDGRIPPVSGLLETVQRGLRAQPKRLPSWLFYDAQGSALFERICATPEYYLTRCEIALMQAHAASIADTLGVDVRLVEYGSGSAIKTRLLLEHMASPVSYVPVEISPEPLRESVQRIGALFAQLPVQPLAADFTRALRLPIPPRAPRRTVIYFPGSTIGNFATREAVALLRKMEQLRSDAQRMIERGASPTPEMETQLDQLLEQVQVNPIYQRMVAAQENFDKTMMRVNEWILDGIQKGAASPIITLG